MTKRIAVLGFLVAAGLAHAGTKYTIPVYIGSTYAWGSIGDARASSDMRAHIGCSTQASPTLRRATCFAANSSGYKSCYTSDPNLIAVAETVTSDSTIEFYLDTNGVTCRSISVTNASYYSPRLP